MEPNTFVTHQSVSPSACPALTKCPTHRKMLPRVAARLTLKLTRPLSAAVGEPESFAAAAAAAVQPERVRPCYRAVAVQETQDHREGKRHESRGALYCDTHRSLQCRRASSYTPWRNRCDCGCWLLLQLLGTPHGANLVRAESGLEAPHEHRPDLGPPAAPPPSRITNH